jgi:mono/diheme cytochrome c family protein
MVTPMRGCARRSRSSLPAALAVAGFLLMTGWTLTAVFAESASPAPSGGLPGDPTKGSQLYGSSGCAGCHGSNLEGGVGPKLNPIVALPDAPNKNPLDPNYLISTIENGKSGVGGYTVAMPPKGGTQSLTPQDIADIAAFIIQTNKAGAAGLGPQELARSNVFWVSVAIFLMVMVTVLLSRYNMRWIDRRAAARRERERTG